MRVRMRERSTEHFSYMMCSSGLGLDFGRPLRTVSRSLDNASDSLGSVVVVMVSSVWFPNTQNSTSAKFSKKLFHS